MYITTTTPDRFAQMYGTWNWSAIRFQHIVTKASNSDPHISESKLWGNLFCYFYHCLEYNFDLECLFYILSDTYLKVTDGIKNDTYKKIPLLLCVCIRYRGSFTHLLFSNDRRMHTNCGNTRWWKRYTKYAVEMGSGIIISPIKTSWVHGVT
jgi:hypothetical protein